MSYTPIEPNVDSMRGALRAPSAWIGYRIAP
jgi:hypothetical protein